MKNLMIAFPNKSLPWYKKTARATYRFFIFQSIYSAYFYTHPDIFLNRLIVNGLEKYENIISKKKPMFFFAAHFGFWELTPLYFGLKGIRAIILYQKIHDKRINDFILKFRNITGHIYLPRNDLKNIIKYAKKGNNFGVLVDQRPNEKGLEKIFFNKKVRFYYTPFKLVRKYNAIPLFVFIHYERGNFHLDIIDNVGKTPEEIAENYIKNLENLIKKYPEQYFWFHNRWKNAK